MKSSKKKIKRFLAVWDMLGLEYLCDLSEIEEQQTWAILKEEPIKNVPNLNMILLRARTNSQRHYEVYTFESDGIEYDTIKEMFDTSPQFIVDLIREKGYKIYSDRISEKTQVIV